MKPNPQGRADVNSKQRGSRALTFRGVRRHNTSYGNAEIKIRSCSVTPVLGNSRGKLWWAPAVFERSSLVSGHSLAIKGTISGARKRSRSKLMALKVTSRHAVCPIPEDYTVAASKGGPDGSFLLRLRA